MVSASDSPAGSIERILAYGQQHVKKLGLPTG
jgi:hypothetical protein